MNIQQAKDIGIDEYLERLGYTPQKKCRNGELVYYSPLHEERSPSFNVNLRKREWYDFGIAEGGSIIDLVMKYHKLNSITEALHHLAKQSGWKRTTPRLSPPPQINREIKFRNIQFMRLEDEKLCSYIMTRGIDLEIAQRLCGEIHYTYYSREYYGIAFANSSGGYDVRNPYYKGCIGRKDITMCHLRRGERQRHVCIFEGFMDLLSFLTLEKKGNIDICIVEPTDYIVLNSVCCLGKCMEVLDDYDYIHCYLDNDFAGISATNKIADTMNGGVIDESERYRGYNDLNDYLRGKKA